jgi:pimeloyl-ACP methyl ester carboxylesterase
MRNLLLGIAAVLFVAAGGYAAFVYFAGNEDPAALEAAYAEPEDRFVEVEGLRVRIREQGPEGAPVLLMLHGFTFSLESYDQLAGLLDDQYRVVRYDLRGHGLTGPDPQKRYAPDQRAAHIGEIMDALAIERASIVGNSLGGLAAWRFAATSPDRVDHLVLISPGAYPMNGVGDEPAPVPPALEAYFRYVPQAGLDASIGRIYADPEAVSEERRQLLGDMMRREGNGQAFVDALKVFTLPDPEPMLDGIDTPTLILWGESDMVIDPAQGEAMVEAMPRARLETLQGVGHVAHEEAPGEVAELIRFFLEEGEGR